MGSRASLSSLPQLKASFPLLLSPSLRLTFAPRERQKDEETRGGSVLPRAPKGADDTHIKVVNALFDFVIGRASLNHLRRVTKNYALEVINADT